MDLQKITSEHPKRPRAPKSVTKRTQTTLAQIFGLKKAAPGTPLGTLGKALEAFWDFGGPWGPVLRKSFQGKACYMIFVRFLINFRKFVDVFFESDRVQNLKSNIWKNLIIHWPWR